MSAGNANLDAEGFAPFGEVVEGMDLVDGMYMQVTMTPIPFSRIALHPMTDSYVPMDPILYNYNCTHTPSCSTERGARGWARARAQGDRTRCVTERAENREPVN